MTFSSQTANKEWSPITIKDGDINLDLRKLTSWGVALTISMVAIGAGSDLVYASQASHLPNPDPLPITPDPSSIQRIDPIESKIISASIDDLIHPKIVSIAPITTDFIPETLVKPNPNILTATPKEGFIWKNEGDIKFTPKDGIQEYGIGNIEKHRFIVEAAPVEIFVGTDGSRYFRGIVEKGGSPVLVKITGEISRFDSSGLNFVSNDDISKLIIPSNQIVAIQFYVGNDESLNQATITEMMRTNTFGNKSLEGKRVALALANGVTVKR